MADVLARLTRALAGRYRVENELGQGGMATVYRAHDLRHDRPVAIKVLRSELALALGAERFLQEIRTTASLRHPHILPLYDSGDADGVLYYVMPLVEGESLRDRLERERQLPLDEALRVAREVADALGHAHARGIVHRDIKPENILLEHGRAVVADFGIARAVSSAGGERLTQAGMAIGTPAYMSPEQAAAEPGVDGRSDLYSLACVLYEMLAGQPPFTGPTAASITHQHLVATAAPVTNLRPAVPAAVAGALARALAKDPADRFNPAAQFAEALAPGAGAGAVTVPATAARPRAPRRLAIIGAGLLAALGVAWLGTRGLAARGGAAPIDRIAVLPMDNQTGDSSQTFFADGMTRELIGVLTDAGVRTLGHRAVVAYRGSTLPPGEIANALGVDAIVTGTVLQAGEVVQVAAELTDPRTGDNLWARTFSRPAPDVVTLQHEIALEIARGIRARLTPDQERALGEARPVHPKAYAQYLLGVEQANLRTTDGLRRSVDHLNRSIAIDSAFAPAWATLATAHALGLIYYTTTPDSARIIITHAAERALARDDRLGDPLLARGMMRFVVDWDFASADRDFRQGMARNPSALAQSLYGWYLWETGQFADAIALHRRLIELEPTTAQWHSDLGWDYWASGDTARAFAAARRAIALDSLFFEAHHELAWMSIETGDVSTARRELDVARRLAGGDYWLRQMVEGQLLARTGDVSGARRVLRAMDRDPRFAQRALLLATLGEKDSMYVMLERAIDARDPDALWVMNAERVLQGWRQEPRFQELLARMGLPEALRQ